jgi:RNA polymerase sigma-70 factor (ECF subfamily)
LRWQPTSFADEARKTARQRHHLQVLAEQERETVVEMSPTTAERAHEQAMARQALDSLAEKDRLALLMREEGLNYEEIAQALELSVGSVGTTLARARRRLAESYESLQEQDSRRAAVGEPINE